MDRFGDFDPTRGERFEDFDVDGEAAVTSCRPNRQTRVSRPPPGPPSPGKARSTLAYSTSSRGEIARECGRAGEVGDNG
jgi:hypothetical protein